MFIDKSRIASYKTLILTHTCKWSSGRINSHTDDCWWTDSSRIDSFHSHSEVVTKTRIAKFGGILISRSLFNVTTANDDSAQDTM